MNIAIISWGSLIRTGRDRGLVTNGNFIAGGPELPVEFSRISQSGDKTGCLTLVLDEQNGVNVPTKFAISTFTNLDIALSNLRIVERIKLTYSVGYVNLIRNTVRGWAMENHPNSCNKIKSWARENDFDAVIWTSLLSNFEEITHRQFNPSAATDYINSLSPELKTKAMNYINESPEDVVTPVKTSLGRITESLGAADSLSPGEMSLLRIFRRFAHH